MRMVSMILAASMVALAVPLVAPAEPIVKDDAMVDCIEDVRVPAQEEGVLVAVMAKDGQEVAKDQVLAKVDDKLVQLQRNVALAELEVAQRRSQDYISVKYAKMAAAVYEADYRRLRQVNAKVKGAVPQAEIELAHLRWDQYVLQADKSEFERGIAELDMKVSEAKKKAAEEHIIRSEIPAPWNGVVDRVARHAGDWVKPGDPILRMYRMDRLRVICALKAKEHAPEDVYGQPVTVQVTLPNGAVETFSARVDGFSSEIDLNDEFRVWTELDNRRRGGFWVLRPGMTATMTIQTKQ